MPQFRNSSNSARRDPKPVTMLRSFVPTSWAMYKKSFWLHAVPICLTVDLQAEFDSEEEWIKENSYLLDLGTQPAFVPV
jgi:hypothetical protein